MTEHQIERWVERQIDRLDARYMDPTAKMTEATYTERMKAIDRAAEGMRLGTPCYTAGRVQARRATPAAGSGQSNGLPPL